MSEQVFESVIFKKKTFGSLLEEIHSSVQNSVKQNKQQIDQMSNFVEEGDFGAALQATDKIQGYIKLNNESNDHLIKLAGIIQKCLEKDKKAIETDDGSISEEERKELEEMARQLQLSSTPVKLLEKS